MSKARPLNNIIRDDRGLEVVEYAIITGLIVLATLAALAAIGVWAAEQFTMLLTEVGG